METLMIEHRILIYVTSIYNSILTYAIDNK